MNSQPLTQKLHRTVDLLALHAANPQQYPFLLESVASGNKLSRYNILFAFPGAQLRLLSSGQLISDFELSDDTHFLKNLDRWFQQNKIDDAESHLPFSGGWFVYLSYELAQEIEPVLELPKSERIQLPVAYACRVPAAIIVDKFNGETWCVCEADQPNLLDVMLHDVNTLHEQDETLTTFQYDIEEENAQQFVSAVEKIKRYIFNGDVFQVNLSRSWQISLADTVSTSLLYQRLRKSNPAPFSALCLIDDVAILSSSPERLFKCSQGIVETRPIAGTRPRVRDAQGDVLTRADEHSLDELIHHPKERAEHVMLIDLERNDLGRIAVPGSVEVNELMVLESYQHVHHIVSNVRARLKPGVSPGEIIAAVFPGGTITGCPKVRCMQIIAELEQTPRYAYTGSLGYINRNGDMDFNILIRTIIQQGSELHVRAGAGIVADSVAERELDETRAKAKGMLKAVTDNDFSEW